MRVSLGKDYVLQTISLMETFGMYDDFAVEFIQKAEQPPSAKR